MTNMGAELGATTSIFPSDEQTYAFLKAQQREQDFTALVADEDADYDESYEIDLDELEPLVAKPHSPDAISTVEEVGAIKVDQVAIGSCTNGSYLDLMKVAAILKGKRVHPDVSLVISPGSKQVLTMLAQNGALADLIASGARILESGCGPCIGMGQAPASHAVSLRTFNRNFYGRCGTLSAQVYLCSPETAAYSAISGTLVSPLQATTFEHPSFPHQFEVLDNSIILPNELHQDVVRGPNIKSFPLNEALKKDLEASVLLKVEDNITTDHIMPSNAKLLPYRSNIPYLSNHCFETIDSTFSSRAKQAKQGFIVGGENYGQGSSREHAALVPLYLGIKAVFAKSFARIHRSNLINSGILPFEFEQSSDYDLIEEGDRLSIKNLKEAIELNQTQLTVTNQSKQSTFTVHLPLSPREKEAILAGGIINLIRQREEA